MKKHLKGITVAFAVLLSLIFGSRFLVASESAHTKEKLPSYEKYFGAGKKEGAHAEHKAEKKEESKAVKVEEKHAEPQASGHGQASAHEEPGSFDEIWANLLEGNRRYAEGKPSDKKLVSRRKELVAGQHPKVIVVTCSDSRVSPEVLFDKGMGELFVIRSAGHVVEPATIGSIEYAAEHLHSKMIVVMGHSKCGAVKAALAGGKMPSSNLDAIVKKIQRVTSAFKFKVSEEKMMNLAVEGNVFQTIDDILAASAIIRKEEKEEKIKIVPAVYSLETGGVSQL